MKKLGRGLGAILEDVEAGYLKSIPQKGIKEIKIDKIILNPYQPRKKFDGDSIKELANSIKKHGLMQPIIVIEDNDKYILVAGERRLRAIKSLGRDTIKALVSDISIKDLREYALIENIQREDLNPLEIAISLKSLIDEYGFTHDELAKNLGKSRTYISNMLRLLNLPENAKEKLLQNKITYGHAKTLIGLEEEKIKKTIEKIEKEHLNVRETENLVKMYKSSKKANEEINKEIIEISSKLKLLGLKIEIGKNFLKVKFKNETDIQKLNKLIDKII